MEDDDDSWVPLEHPVETPRHVEAHVTEATIGSASVVDDESHNKSSTESSATSQQLTRTTNKRHKQQDSIQALQRRVEMRQHLKKRLVHHPIQLLWSHFLWHLGHEFWSLDVKIRIALVLIAMGAIAKVTCIMTWYLWYPRMIFMTCLLLGSWVYLDPNGIPRRIQRFFQGLAALPNRIPETLEQLDPQQARMLCIAFLFLPTLLQMRTISFLADLNATGGGWIWNGFVTLLLAVVCGFCLTTSHHTKKVARDISQICILVLYGTALWITLRQWNVLTMPSLVGPFCLSTGTLLLSYDDHDNMEWFSRMIRQALRLTLRDILTTVGTSVQEDEMLQLAMLRWIVDYWSCTPATQQQTATTAAEQSTNPTTSASSEGHGSSSSTPHCPSGQAPRKNIEWNELLPMLNVATDQMSEEVHTLQQPSAANPSSTPARDTTNIPADHSLRNFQSMLASMNVDYRAKPAVAAYKRNVERFPPTRQLALLVSVTRRCPVSLVFLWQFLIASMFQSYSTTFRIFILLIPLMILEGLRVNAWVSACESLSRILEETPGAALSLPPSEQPKTSSTRTRSKEDPICSILPNVDPMTILLSGDEDTFLMTTIATDSREGATNITTKVTVPTLLLVWRNIQSSVRALEVSLTAARCVETGAVAVDFAKNIMSLAKFGVEVSQHGWMHGLTVIVKEVIFQNNSDRNTMRETTYTHAAVSAVQNGQRVAHNLRVLAVEDDHTSQVLAPIVGFFGFIGGLFHPKQDGNEQATGSASDDAVGQPDSTEESNQDGNGKVVAIETLVISNNKDACLASTSEVLEPHENKSMSNQIDEGEKQGKSSSDNESAAVWNAIDAAEEQGKATKNSIDAIVEQSGTPISQPSVVKEQDTEQVSSRADLSAVSKELEDISKRKEEAKPTVVVNGTTECNSASNSDDVIGLDDTQPLAANAAEENQKEKGSKHCNIHDSSKGLSFEESATGSPNTNENLSSANKADEAQVPENLGVVMDLIAEAFEKELIDESEKNEFCMKLSANNDNVIVHGMKKTLEGLLMDAGQDQLIDAAGPPAAAKEAQKTRRFSDRENVDDEDAWNPIVPTVASQEERMVQSSNYIDRLESAVNSTGASSRTQLSEREGLALLDGDGIPTVESSAPQRRRDEENMWVKVGGSMAVLGAAVVGGAFLAMNQANANNRQDENQTNQASVRIEMLDDDEDENANEWEASTGDANTQAQ